MSAHQDKTVGWIRTFLARKRVATWMGAVWCASITHAVCSARLSGETMTSSGSHRLTAFCDPTARSARCRRWTGVKTQLARSIPVARWLAGRQKLLVERRDALLFPAPIAPACQAGGTSMRFRSWRVRALGLPPASRRQLHATTAGTVLGKSRGVSLQHGGQ